jgi:glucose-6-phosphate isomerase
VSGAPAFSLGAHDTAFRRRLAALREGRFGPRLAAHDDGLWVDDDAHRKVAANRLGWLDTPASLAAAPPELEAFAAEVAAEGFTHVVLLGMGGSSLAPEVLRHTFGVRPGRLELTVLDNTSPAAVRAIAASHDPRRTMFLVSSKSGGTIEVVSFEKYFWEWVRAARGETTGRAFAAVTDPGTSLGALAASRGYRRTFLNPPDLGGRYSALSYFGLVPAALLGADTAALLAAARAEHATLAGEPAASAGLALGAALGELALAGRDKLTLVFPPALASFGTWVEQLVAESTGKLGRGIVPVEGEPLAPPAAYGDDRVFVAAGALEPGAVAALDALAAAGHPVIRWDASPATLGAEFLRWEIATATAGAVLGVDPFDEPNVSEAKAATQLVLERYRRENRFPERTPVSTAAGMAAFAPAALAGALGDRPAAWLAALAGAVRPGDYVAMLAYLHRTESRAAHLQALRLALRARTRAATTLGWGPRFLHSTGQLHKGGADNGVFLQITADEGDAPVPGEDHGFAVLRAAQAAGDYDVLEARGRRVIRVHLGADPDARLAVLAGSL